MASWHGGKLEIEESEKNEDVQDEISPLAVPSFTWGMSHVQTSDLKTRTEGGGTWGVRPPCAPPFETDPSQDTGGGMETTMENTI